MRIAIATQDLTRIDAHLGWARHFLFYELSAEGYHFAGLCSFNAGLVADGNHDKLIPRLQALRGCDFIFLTDLGPDGEYALLRAKVYPVRRHAGQPVALALDAMVVALRDKPTPWLRRLEQRRRQDKEIVI